MLQLGVEGGVYQEAFSIRRAAADLCSTFPFAAVQAYLRAIRVHSQVAADETVRLRQRVRSQVAAEETVRLQQRARSGVAAEGSQ